MNPPLSKPNRPAPLTKFPKRPECNVELHDDGRISLSHLTQSEAWRIYELACNDAKLYALTYVMAQVLGITDEEMDA